MKGSIWSDIDDRWIRDGQGGVKLALNAEAVKVSLNNILGTERFSRVMLPNFGASLDDFLFENFDEDIANRITDTIKTQITMWDPRINLLQVIFNPDIEGHLDNINVLFSIVGDDSVQSLNIPVSKGD